MKQEQEKWLHMKKVEEDKHSLALQQQKMEAAKKILLNLEISDDVKQMASTYLKSLFAL